MVICKFFVQGTCKFGTNCRFEHQLSNENYYQSPILQNPNFTPPSNQAPTPPDINCMVNAATNDMTSAEKGGQWLLSCYGPFKDKPAFPGFEDYSMEEIRFQFYEAIKSGTGEIFKQNLQMMIQQAILKVKALQNPTPEIANLLKSIYNSAPSGAQVNQFGGNKPAFEPAASIFPTNNVPNPGQSIFGRNVQNQQNTFSTNPSSIFGGQSPSTINVPSPSKSIFGEPAMPNNQTMFANNSIFQQPAQQQSIFQPSNANMSPIKPTKTPEQHSANIFGMQTNPVQLMSQPNPEFYSELKDLTEAEILWFRSEDLDIMSIPDKPPPSELVFNNRS